MQRLTARPWSTLPGEAAGPRARQVRSRAELAKVTIHHPEDPAGLAAATRLRDHLVAHGAEVRVSAATAPERVPGSPLLPDDPDRVDILLGGLSTNPRIAQLYHAWLCPVDADFPGAGGHYLRLHQDLVGDGRATVIVGVSALDDLNAAVDVLVDRLDGLVLDQLHEVRIPEAVRAARPWLNPDDPVHNDFRERARQAYRTQTHRGATPYLSHAGDMLVATGDRRFAQLYLDIIQDMVVDTADWTPDQWGRWGFDADFQACRVISSWHGIADSAWFTEEDRGRIAGHLLAYLGNSVDQWHGHRESPHPARHNHYTFASLGLVFGALLLGPVHDLAQTEQWWEMVDECFEPTLDLGKSCEDCDSYGWHAFSHILRYALLRPVPSYLDGSLSRVLDRAIVVMDSLGSQAPFGDSSGHRGQFGELEYWRPASWILDEPRWNAATHHKERARGQAVDKITGLAPLLFDYDVTPETDLSLLNDHLGVRVLPLDEGYLQTYDTDPAPDNGFDKISLRRGFGVDDRYLLLDGIDNGAHGHRDAGAVVRFVSRNRIWLEDAEYDKISANFHNTVVVARDGLTGDRPPYATLGEVTSLADQGCGAPELVSCRYLDWSGADWDRTVVDLGSAGVVVVDRVTAREAGDFEVTALWRTVGATELADQRWTITMGEESLPIHTVTLGDGERRRREVVEDHIAFRHAWDGYPWGQGHQTVLQDTVRRRLAVGESIIHVHLLAEGPGAQDAWLSTTGGSQVIARIAENELQLDPLRPGDLSWAPVRGWQIPADGPVAVLGDLVATAHDTQVRLWRDGASVASFSARAKVSALGAAPDGALVVGQHDGLVSVHEPDGSHRWAGEFPAHMGHEASVTAIATAVFDTGPAILTGTESCHVHAWSLNGEELWRYEVVHGARDVASGMLDGTTAVVASTGYWTWHVLDQTGTPRFQVRGREGSGAEVAVVHAGLAVFGGWDGHVTAWRPDGTVAWDLPTGDVVTAIVPDGDDLVIACRAGRMYRVDAEGTLLWWQSVAVDALVLTSGGVAAASGRSLCWFATDGTISRTVSLSAPAVALWSTPAGLVVQHRDAVTGPIPERGDNDGRARDITS